MAGGNARSFNAGKGQCAEQRLWGAGAGLPKANKKAPPFSAALLLPRPPPTSVAATPTALAIETYLKARWPWRQSEPQLSTGKGLPEAQPQHVRSWRTLAATRHAQLFACGYT